MGEGKTADISSRQCRLLAAHPHQAPLPEAEQAELTVISRRTLQRLIPTVKLTQRR
jgi:hypothetical protein